jgi:subtilisin family serine protease
MESFANFLRIYFRNHPLEKDREIKVAVIDDGVNLDHPDVRGNIVAGETFYNNNGHWQGFYQSSQGHGTLMASIICQLCPKVKLYVAKLNEVWVNSQSQITAESAAAAIEWAVGKEVDIISMSWSIENPGEGEGALRAAVDLAVNNDILLFCASNDQGNQGSERPYPARLAKDSSCFYIGAATVWGRIDPAVHNLVDYTAPGAEEVKEPMSSPGAATAAAATMPSPAAVGAGAPASASELQIGSSIATARVAGLAAAMLQSISAAQGRQAKQVVRTHKKAKKMFNYLAEEGDKYLHVGKIFDEPNRPRAGVRNADSVALAAVAENLVKISQL